MDLAFDDMYAWLVLGQAKPLLLTHNYTQLVISSNDKNRQLTIIQPTWTRINREKYTFCNMQSFIKKFKNGPVLYWDLKLTIHVIKSQSISWDSPFLKGSSDFFLSSFLWTLIPPVTCAARWVDAFYCRLFVGLLSCDVRMRSTMSGCCAVSGAGTSSRAPSTRRRHRSSAPS